MDRFLLAIPNAIYWLVTLTAIGIGSATGWQDSGWGAVVGGSLAVLLLWLAFRVAYVAIKVVLGLILTTITLAVLGLAVFLVIQVVSSIRASAF